MSNDIHGIDPASIPLARRDAYAMLTAAHAVSAQAELTEKAADDVVAAAVREHDRAVAAAPKSSFGDLHKAAVAAWKQDHR